MIRFVALAFVALLAFTFTLVAGEIKGKVKSTDAKEKTFVVTTKDGDKTEDKTIKVGDKVKWVTGKDGTKDFEGGLEKLKADTFVTITTADEDDKDKGIKKGDVIKVQVKGGKAPPPR